MLDAAVAGRIAACAGLHNRIVHEYEELDPAKVFDAIQTALRDIPVYLEAVDEFVVRREVGGGAWRWPRPRTDAKIRAFHIIPIRATR